jgi:hypothetical protein
VEPADEVREPSRQENLSYHDERHQGGP